VHINAGTAGLEGAIIVGKRLGYGRVAMPPHNLPFVMIGTSLLWVGWFGFNVGSNLQADSFAGLVFLNTFVCTATAVCAWVFAEWVLRGRPTLLGGASGAVAGLVAITPACGVVGPGGAIVLGLMAGITCLWAVAWLKGMLGYDDSLDVFGVHAVGGMLGALMAGVLVSPRFGGTGLAGYAMGTQVLKQLASILITLAWSGLTSTAIFMLLRHTIGLRPSWESEHAGLDTVEHGERAYN
jgi:Amt family ammonium transporter